MTRPPLSFLLALSLVGLTAVGCSSDDDALSGSGGAVTADPAPADVDAAPVAAAPGGAAEAKVPVDENLPTYQRGEAVTGTLVSKGSDTMRTVMELWCEGFSDIHPGFKYELESKGSSSAPAALIEGTANVGVMSRAMKDSEIQQFEAKFGYKPTEIKTSRDLLAVFVHKDNPVESLTLPQVDAIFSANRNLGMEEAIGQWGGVGVPAPLGERSISLYGRNSASGTYGYFKEVALGDGDFSDQVKEQPGTAGIVQAIAEDVSAIGYGGVGALTAGVKTVPLAEAEGGEYFEPSVENADTGDYPLARFLLIYVNKAPDKELDPLTAEFLTYVFSTQGQEKVVQAGYFPVSAAEAEAQLAAAGLSDDD